MKMEKVIEVLEKEIAKELEKDSYIDLLTFIKILLKRFDSDEYFETREQMEEKIKAALDHLYRN